MGRYTINNERLINKLVPHYIGGRNIILYLQAICKPLQDLNDWFCEWVKETKIEMAMTSQVFYFEWYLNHKFKKYFKKSTEVITISDGVLVGTVVYLESATNVTNMALYNEGETGTTAILYMFGIDTVNSADFYVNSPAIDTSIISEDEYSQMLNSVVNKYRIACKKYLIKINQE